MHPAHDPTILPPNLPVPIDDGAANHLQGMPVAPIDLESTEERTINLAHLTRTPTVLFFYPRTGVPGRPAPRFPDGSEWDLIPGMRGCTPQSCGFRDLYSEFRALSVAVHAISTQNPDYQREFAQRMHLPFPVLSDASLALVRAMRLPTINASIETGGPATLIKRMAWYCDGSRIVRVWYPVFPPNENAANVLAWLRAQQAGPSSPRSTITA